MRNRVARFGLRSACVLLVLATARAGGADDDKSPRTLRDGFESPKRAWRQERTDTPVRIFFHDRTNRAAREGQQSEGFQFEAGIGSGLYYSYRLPNVPVTDELKVGLYVRSNRTGAQLLGRVILPDDVDPDSRQPSFVLVPGTIFESSERWQRLELADMLPSVERQARVLRASTKRPVSLKGAYLERLVMNLYGGEGETEVYLDELSIGPVPAEIAANPRVEPPKGPTARTISDMPRGPQEPLEAVQPGLNTRINLDRNRLTKDGFPWFFSAVRAPGVDPSSLRRVGCDALVVPRDVDEASIRAAVASGLLLIPELTGPDDRTMPEADQLVARATSFPGREAVAFHSIGEGLGRTPDLEARKATLRRVRDGVRAIHKARPGGSPLTTATVLGLLPEYARTPENLDVIGIPTNTWATTQEPMGLFRYLEQRRLLTARSNSDALFWATIDASPPPIYRESIWGTDTPPLWGRLRVQPEQIRLSTYAALAAGCRGLCYRADSDLTGDLGRQNLLEIALLNEEIDLLEPILADPDKSIRMIDTYLPDPPPPPPMTLFQMNLGTTTRPPTPKEYEPHPSIKAAAITTKDRRGTLLMIADYGHPREKYYQYQPPQAAMNNLVVRTPASTDARAYLLTPGGVKSLKSNRTPGGIEVILDDFGVTALVLVTTNLELKDQIERAINRVRPMAVGFAIEQAELLRSWVVEIDSQIQTDEPKHKQRDSADLLRQSGELIKSAREALEREDYLTAWEEARRVGRPLRILMRSHYLAAYDAIVKALNNEELPCGPVHFDEQEKPIARLVGPMVAAPLASFSTLPQAWTWYEWIKAGRLGRNLIPDGNFNDPDTLEKDGWAPVSYETEDIETTIRLNKGGPDQVALEKGDPAKEERRNLFMEAKPRKGVALDSLAPFVDHPIVALRSPNVEVKARQVYRVSVMVFMINPAVPGAGGLIVRDSIGGERLQFRTPDGLNDWFEVVYYRYVPTDGTLNVTLGMANYGWAAFDDLKVEPIVEQINDLEQYKLTLRKPRPPRRRTASTETNSRSRSRSNPDKDADAEKKDAPSRPPTANRLQGAPPVRQ